MNDYACNKATDRPVSLNNEATPEAAVFAGAAPASTDATATAATTIFPDAHIPPSGGKLHTKPFSPVNMNNMYKKYRIKTTTELYAPTAAPADASDQSLVLTVSNSPYSLRHLNFTTRSISTKTTSKKKNDDKVTF